MSTEVHVNGRRATQEVIQYEVADGVATIWLNRPEVKNCVNWELLTNLGAALERAEDDDDVRVVLIRGRGHTFCAGADLNMLDSEFLGTTNNSVKIAQVSARTFDRAFNLAKPTIAVVEGYAVAGGFELMISCDFCIAADDAKIGDFHIRRALFGGAGPIYRLPRYIGLRKTKELLFTGKLLSGKECEDWGLANVSAPGRGARAGDRRLRRADEGQERVHDAHHEARGEPRPGRRHRDAHRAREHDLQRRPPVRGRARGRAGVPREARPRLAPPLSAAMDFAFDATTLELRERLLRVHGRARVPRGAAVPRGGRGRRRPVADAAGHRGAQGPGARARAVEPVPAADPRPRRGPDERAVRAARGDHRPQPVDRARGAELLGAGHREHGAPVALRHAGAEGALARAAARRRRSARRSR